MRKPIPQNSAISVVAVERDCSMTVQIQNNGPVDVWVSDDMAALLISDASGNPGDGLRFAANTNFQPYCVDFFQGILYARAVGAGATLDVIINKNTDGLEAVVREFFERMTTKPFWRK